MSINSNSDQIPKDNINICFVGGVSTGKSTILNAIFCEQLTQCKIKRTTMVPTVYIENSTSIADSFDPTNIYKTIEDKNQEIIKLTENSTSLTRDNYDELIFNVGKLDINILSDSFVNVYDIPGLNDARTKDVYYEYLASNFHKFNLVVFLVDIHSGLNTSDEIDIVNFITTNIKFQLENNNRKIYSLVIVNKVDDMQLDEESDNPDKLILTGELVEMYEQVENTINSEFTRKQVQEHLIGIIPLCAIDSYLYRMVKKHGRDFKLSPEQILKIGINENGKKFSTLKPSVQESKVYEILNDSNFIQTMIKLSGFSSLEKILHNFLTRNDTGKQIRIDNLLYDLRDLEQLNTIPDKSGWFDLDVFEIVVSKYYEIYSRIKLIDIPMYNELMESITEQIQKLLQTHILETNVEKEELLELYINFVEQIIIKYCKDFVQTDKFPEYLTNKLIGMIEQELKSRLTIKSMCAIFEFVKKIDKFELNTIVQLINEIIKNIHQENTIDFTNLNSEELIALANDFIGLNIVISQLLRFLLINQIYSLKFSDDMLMEKLMIYQKYGEIPLRNYIEHHIDSKQINLKSYIKGLNENILSSPAYELDLFYLNYEKSNSTINFI
jgi:GTP-binding protein EngB required for normal cell division